MAQKGATVLLLHSPETAEFAEKRLVAALGDYKCKAIRLSDPYDPDAVFQSVKALKTSFSSSETVALNYTGGTKIMSAFALLAWQETFGTLDHTFYLQENVGRFRTGTKTDPLLQKNLFNIDDLCTLHEVQPDPSPYPLHVEPEDLSNIFNDWGTVGFPNRVEQSNPREWEPAWNRFFALLSKRTRTEWGRITMQDKRFGKLLKFAHGQWLETLVKRTVICLDKNGSSNFNSLPAAHNAVVPEREVHTSRYFKVYKQQFEADVICVVNNRLCFFSMGVNRGADKGRVLRGKMFEANYRAKQLGGGLARSCVVCLAPEPVIKDCRASLGNDSHNTIFGRDDVERWINGDAQDLYQFLTT